MSTLLEPRVALWRAIGVPAAVTVLTLSGCADRVAEPSAGRAATALRADVTTNSEPTMSARWSAITRDFISAKNAATKPNAVAVLRAFAYLSLAQYRAVVAAERDVGHPPHPSPQGAVAAASAAVLSGLFPADAAFFESQLALQESEGALSDNPARSFAEGESVGRSVAAAILERARTDRFDAVWTGTVPVGAAYWRSDFTPPRPPQLPLLGQMRPFFMQSGDQFRPGPPPAVGSPDYLAALAEIRQLSDNRTAEQLGIAQFWALTTGSLTAGFWNEETTKRIERYHLNERRAARTLALVHMAAMDATIGCYDAKYAYWLVRPYQADAAITTPIGRPNHPSYPSSHACSSAASATVLASLFPSDAVQLEQMAEEAGESRLYAGIHYRFDKEAGLRIGRQAAALALRHQREDRHRER